MSDEISDHPNNDKKNISSTIESITIECEMIKINSIELIGSSFVHGIYHSAIKKIRWKINRYREHQILLNRY